MQSITYFTASFWFGKFGEYMRLWSLHPQYLDSQGLVALWREGLLAQKVLLGETRGYRHHPQLERFKEKNDPVLAIGTYLQHIAAEAEARGYDFDRSKIVKARRGSAKIMRVSRGQLKFEFEHLKAKLKVRAPKRFAEVRSLKTVRPHPSFRTCAGAKAPWERA